MVGLIPLFAVETWNRSCWKASGLQKAAGMVFEPPAGSRASGVSLAGAGPRRAAAVVAAARPSNEKTTGRMLDESEFLSDYGVRALSRAHLAEPYVLKLDHADLSVGYAPGESESRQFGGNSNWRGPIWFPMNFLIIESLQKFHHYYGNDFKVECPTGSGRYLTIDAVAQELSQRLSRLFLKDARGERPVLRHQPELANGPVLPGLHPLLRVFSTAIPAAVRGHRTNRGGPR